MKPKPILKKSALVLALFLAGAHGQRFDWAVPGVGSGAKQLAEIVSADPRRVFAVWTAGVPSGTAPTSVHVTRLGGANGSGTQLAVFQSGDADLIARSAAADPSGAVYVLGEFDDTVTAGNLGARGLWSRNAYLAKVGSDGSPAWIRRVASSNRSPFTAGRMTLDGQGNPVITGEFQDSVQVGDSTFRIVEPGFIGHRMGTYLAKFDTAGNLLWATHYLAAGHHPSETVEWFSPDVAVNRAGEVFVAGNFDNLPETRFDTVSFPGGRSGNSLYLVKYSSGGRFAWVRILAEGTAYADASALAIDSSGSLLVGGHHRGTLAFKDMDTTYDAGKTPSGSSDQDLFLAKLDPQGQPLWIRREGSDYQDALHDVAVDPDGNVHIAGFAWHIPGFRDSTYPGQPDSVYGARTFVRRYLPDGSPAWTKHVSEAGSRVSLAAFRDAVFLGSSVIRGSEPIRFDQISLTTGNLRDLFVARISPQALPSGVRPAPLRRRTAIRRRGPGTPAFHLPPATWSDALGRSERPKPKARP